MMPASSGAAERRERAARTHRRALARANHGEVAAVKSGQRGEPEALGDRAAGVAGGLQSTAMQVGGTLGTAVLGAVMSARVDSLLPANWHAAHLPPLTAAQLSGAKAAVSVGIAPVSPGLPAPVVRTITSVAHATFASGMHAAFLVGAAVALAAALIALLTRRGTGGEAAAPAGAPLAGHPETEGHPTGTLLREQS